MQEKEDAKNKQALEKEMEGRGRGKKRKSWQPSKRVPAGTHIKSLWKASK